MPGAVGLPAPVLRGRVAFVHSDNRWCYQRQNGKNTDGDTENKNTNDDKVPTTVSKAIPTVNQTAICTDRKTGSNDGTDSDNINDGNTSVNTDDGTDGIHNGEIDGDTHGQIDNNDDTDQRRYRR